MRTVEPADRNYGEKRPLSPGVHQISGRYHLAAMGSHVANGRKDPSKQMVNPMNWAGYAAAGQIEGDGTPDRVYSSPYGDTTVVQSGEGMVITKNPQQRFIPQMGVNTNIGATDSRVEKEQPNQRPLGMNTGLRLGSGPQRNVPKA